MSTPVNRIAKPDEQNRIEYGLFIVATVLGLYLITRVNYLLFHSIVELFSIIIASTVFIITWNSARNIKNPYLVMIGISCLFISILDLLHTLSYKGMAVFIDYDYYANQLWIAARALESATLLVSFALLGKGRRVNAGLLFISYSVVTALLIASIFYWKTFPVCFVADKGQTSFKIYSEYVICAILAVSMFLLIRNRALFTGSVYKLLLLSISFTIISELAFTFYIDNYGISNLVGHFFKLFAFLMIYHAVVKTGIDDPLTLIFKEVSLANEQLQAQSAELQAKNEELARLWNISVAAEESIRDSDQRSRLATEASGVGIWEWNVTTNQIHWDKQMFLMYGITPTDDGRVPFNDWAGAVLPEDLPQQVAMLQASAHLGGKNFREFSILRRDDNECRIIQAVEMERRNAQGSIEWVLGTNLDVTERKRAEEVLRASEQRFRKVFEHAATGIAIADFKGNYVICNDAYCALVGYSHEELSRSVFPALIHPDDREYNLGFTRQLQCGEIPSFEIEIRYIKKDGSVVFVHKYVSSLQDESGRPTHIIALTSDMTERVRAEEQIHFQARMLDAVGQAVIATDINHTIIYWNRASAALFGWSRDEVIGANLSELLPPRMSLEQQAEITALLQRGEIWTGEIEIPTKDGRMIPLLTTNSPVFNAQGAPVAVIGVGTDITERKEAELTLLHAKETAESATNFKSSFIANMSHEIRTPMNAILGLTFLLQKASLPYHEKELIQKIRAAGQTLLSIVNDILDFSKIEAGHLEIEQAPFLLNNVIDNLGTLMASAVGNKLIELVITPPLHGNLQLRGDALRLGQVLINLVGNAIKFTDQGHVEASIKTMAETENQITLRFSVSDTGIGISPDKLQEIFLSFTQADASTTRHFGGTGLGLAISRRLVELMGGQLEVSSTPGIGSEFSFTLTFERLPVPVISSENMRHVDVLIAADDRITRESLRLTTTGLGWNTIVVGSGEALVRTVLERQGRSGSDQVLLVDWKMQSGMDGLAAIRSIHKTLGTSNAPINIIMINEICREEFLVQPNSQIADGILSKPITSSSLYDCVLRVRQERDNADTMHIQPQERRLDDLRILVVDDSDINRDVAQRIFADEGAQVALAENGQQAISWLRAHPDRIDIVLMDIQMPVMDGYEATRLIRAIPKLTALPVVALTAGVFFSQKEEARNAGMTDFIIKPFDLELAIALIRRLTNHNNKIASFSQAPVTRSVGSHQELPGISVGRGLKLWKDKKVYQQYLLKFARDYKDILEIMAQVDTSGASALAHKLKGAAGSLALDDIAECAGEVERLINLGKDTSGASARLQSALEITLTSIEIFAPGNSQKAPHTETGSHDHDQVSALLGQVLTAFNSDNPDYVMPVLTELSKVLPPELLSTLYMAVEDFDFRGGEISVRLLAAELAIEIESLP